MSSTMLRLNSFESPPGGLSPDRERAIRHLLESVVRETLEAGDKRTRSWLPRRPPKMPTFRAGMAIATAAVLMAVSLVMASVLRPDAEVAQAATPSLIGHETSAGEPAAGVLDDLAGRAADTAAVAADTTIRTERWSLAVTVDGPADGTEGAAEGAAPAEGEAEGAVPPEGPAGEGEAEGAVQGEGEGAAPDSDAAAGAASVTTAIIPVQREVTRHDDGSVAIREVGGEPQFPNQHYRRAWDDDGQPGPHGQVLRDETVTAAAYPRIYPTDLPTAPAELKEVLTRDRPAARNSTGELFRAVHDLRNEQALGGAVQAGLLEMLAAEDDVVTLGRTTDRADRSVVAIATDGDESGWPVRHVLLLDPDDGEMLGYEQVLTEDVARLDVAAPAVIDYTIFR